MRNSNWKGTGVAALAIGGLLLLGACSDDGDDDASGTDDTEAPDDTTAGGGGGDGVTIAGFAFTDATVAAEATVTVTNDDGTTHTFTSDDDAWDELSLPGGESGEITAPTEPGEYAFHCEIHSSMTGTLTVE